MNAVNDDAVAALHRPTLIFESEDGDLVRCLCGEQGFDFEQGRKWFAEHKAALAAAPLPCPYCAAWHSVGHRDPWEDAAPLPSEPPDPHWDLALGTRAEQEAAPLPSDTPARTVSFDSVNATGRPSDTPAKPLVHNHGTESGKGVGCREYLIGECRLPSDTPAEVAGYMIDGRGVANGGNVLGSDTPAAAFLAKAQDATEAGS